jgi:hypothetical protein
MVELYRKADNSLLGTISEAELQFLVDHLEEESLTDDDYAMDRLTLEYLKENGMSAHLYQMLDGALGDQDEVEIRYRRQ